MPEETCIFCKIVRGEEQSHKVYEDEHLLAFLDIEPVNKGHTLVIPKKHYPTILDVEPDEMANLARVFKTVSAGLKQEFGYDAFNIHQNNGRVAGQVVDHIHFHIWPRHSQDQMEIKFPNNGISYTDGEMQELAGRLAISFQKG